jgi:AcrR family transcriptional regulator
MTTRSSKTYRVQRPDQRQALSSAIRLEILGAFTNVGGMSIGDVAERLGKRAGSLYYHFGLLEKAGLLRRVGERPAGKKPEALFEPVADRIEIDAPSEDAAAVESTLKTMASAFRMAERDLDTGLREGTARTSGRYRNFVAYRMHMRLNKKTLAEINGHLRALEELIAREARRKQVPKDADQYCSLTLALLPLRGRIDV